MGAKIGYAIRLALSLSIGLLAVVDLMFFAFLAWTFAFFWMLACAARLLRRRRPLLPEAIGVALFLVVAAATIWARGHAMTAVDDVGREMRAACVRDGKCPASPSGWAPDPHALVDADHPQPYVKELGVLANPFRTRYAVAADGRSFTLRLLEGFGDGAEWSGGIDADVHLVDESRAP